MIDKIYLQKNLRLEEPNRSDIWGSGVPDNATFDLKGWIQSGIVDGTFAGTGGITDLLLGPITGTSIGILNNNGTGFTLGSATNALAGLMSATDKSNLTNIIALSGLTANSSNLGTFSGITISDNTTIKNALQELETSLELKGSGLVWQEEGISTGLRNTVANINFIGSIVTAAQVGNQLSVTIAGTNITATHNPTNVVLTSSTGTGQTIQSATTTLGGIMTNIDRVTLNAYPSLTGLASSATNLGTFTGNIITDNTSIYVALQELEQDIIIRQKSLTWQEDGVSTGLAGTVETINFVGTSLTATQAGSVLTITSALAGGGGGGGATAVNLSATVNTNSINVQNDTGGTAIVLPLATATLAGLMHPTQFTKLDTISGTNTGDVSTTDSGSVDFTLTGQNITAQISNIIAANVGDIPRKAIGNTIEWVSPAATGININDVVTSQQYYEITPIGINQIPTLTSIPLDFNDVSISINGLETKTGISVNNAGVFNVDSVLLGYSIDVNDRIIVQYFS